MPKVLLERVELSTVLERLRVFDQWDQALAAKEPKKRQFNALHKAFTEALDEYVLEAIRADRRRGVR